MSIGDWKSWTGHVLEFCLLLHLVTGSHSRTCSITIMGISLDFLLGWSPCFHGPLTSFLINSLILQKPVSNSFLKRIAWEAKFCFADTGSGIFSLKLLFLRILTVCYYTAFLLPLLLVVTLMSSNT